MKFRNKLERKFVISMGVEITMSILNELDKDMRVGDINREIIRNALEKIIKK